MYEKGASVRWRRSWLIMTPVIALVLAACSGGATPEPGPRSDSLEPGGSHATSTTRPRLASSNSPIRVRWAAGYELRVELLTLARTPANATLLRLRLTSYEPDGVDISDQFFFPYEAGGSAALSLIDAENRLRYLVLRDRRGNCLCTQHDFLSLQPRQSMMFHAYFPAPPRDVGNVTVDFPTAFAFYDIPLGTIEDPSALPPQPRPSQVETKPQAVPLTQRVIDTEGSSRVKRTGDKTKVRLSAKVLFDLNKATLRPTARQELREVADRIESADPGVVHIDGYTDSSGGPQINIPLSKNRAQSVKQALQRLVEGDSVRFDAEGHGANNPIATNSTPEGRQKNRRVVVTFTR